MTPFSLPPSHSTSICCSQVAEAFDDKHSMVFTSACLSNYCKFSPLSCKWRFTHTYGFGRIEMSKDWKAFILAFFIDKRNNCGVFVVNEILHWFFKILIFFKIKFHVKKSQTLSWKLNSRWERNELSGDLNWNEAHIDTGAAIIYALNIEKKRQRCRRLFFGMSSSSKT